MTRTIATATAIVMTLAAARPAFAGIDVNAEAELAKLAEGQPAPLHFRRARHRVAVFTFEDPDRSGLGDLAAGLIARRIVSGSFVRSIGVIRYTGTLTPALGQRGLSYFDKVDKLAAAQGVELSVWGSIHKVRGALRIDAYLQIHEEQMPGLTFALPLAGCKSATLHARLRPTRVLLARLELTAAEVTELAGHLPQLDEIRDHPSATAPVLCTLEPNEVVSYLGESGGWAQVAACHRVGWVNVRPECGRGCDLLDEAARFSGELLGALERGGAPEVSRGLGTDALALSEQLAALRTLHTAKVGAGLAIARQWTGPSRLVGRDPATGIDRGSGVPPGGAAFANVIALLGLSSRAGQQPVPPAALLVEAEALAEALQSDPLNADVLGNLETLFRCAGDARRAQQAAALPRR